ncbi:RNA polymerase sigma factor [Maribacter halichondriae]|uniref:RNA polymerase sigma factor n=1 Tax=Maribacter halichondriae TaxID=2980554 RepID=UPI00235947ED|nr:RNA polymerase sigma factor [Maribacter sp. Hal144]
MSADNDQLEIRNVLNGDTKAFAILVNRYKNMVFSLALQLLKNREEAEEVSQDVFLKIFKALEKFKGDSKFSTWVYRITYNTCLDQIKSNNRKQTTVVIDEINENQIRTMETALDIMDRSDREKSIKECLGKLPTEDGTLIRLFYYEELSLAEISKIVSLDKKTLKVRLFRARKRLAVILRTHLEPIQLQNYGQGNR